MARSRSIPALILFSSCAFATPVWAREVRLHGTLDRVAVEGTLRYERGGSGVTLTVAGRWRGDGQSRSGVAKILLGARNSVGAAGRLEGATSAGSQTLEALVMRFEGAFTVELRRGATQVGLLRSERSHELATKALVAYARRKYGNSAARRVREWLGLKHRPGEDSLALAKRVNGWANDSVAWVDDESIWRQPDYWATPLESLGRGEGDCEDYATLKYLTMRRLGVPASRMRMAAVTLNRGRGPEVHMVLLYLPSPGADPIVLDNVYAEVVTLSKRTDLKVIYTFDEKNMYIRGAGDAQPKPVAPASALSKWTGLLRRRAQQRREAAAGG